MKRAGIFLVIFTTLCVAAPASRAQPAPESASPETRLLGAIKLWGDVKFFDPGIATESVDWDAAFMKAEPELLAAANRNAYADALERMLASLNDPATHLTSDTTRFAARLTATSAGTVTVIAVRPGDVEPQESLEANAAHAVDLASKTHYVVFDLRGANESNDAAGATLQYFFSSESPITKLLSGDVTLPRARSRNYLGYPNQGPGFEGYSPQDWITDAIYIEGSATEPHRFGFFVDADTSLPPMALALAQTHQATIFTSAGQPSVLSESTATIALPEGIFVAFRTGDLADVAPHQQFASETAASLADVIGDIQAQSPRAAIYAAPELENVADDRHANRLFPQEPMRMLAIARVYNVIRYFSPYRALMNDDWDAAAREAIRDERTVNDSRSYLLGLMRFYAHLHDSHGFVEGPITGMEFGAGPPFRARYLHRQVVVAHLFADETTMRGIRIGDVIDSVDGVPIRIAMDRIEPYNCSSTPQSADSAAIIPNSRPSVFSGRRGTILNLAFHHPGETRSFAASFTRDYYRPKPAPSSPKYMVLAGNVGYVDFDRLEVSEVDAMFAALQNTRAIVFDNRGYPRGAAWPIAPRLTTRTNVRLALFDTPLVMDPLDQQLGEADPLPAYREFYQMMNAASGSRYLKPTVMLVDERTISQAEHSALFLREAAHTRFVGTPTVGANGDVTSMVVPGNVTLYFSGEGVRWADGRQLQRVGIIPDVRVEPTALDIAQGNDVVLQRGLDEALRLSGENFAVRAAAVRQETARELAAGPNVAR